MEQCRGSGVSRILVSHSRSLAHFNARISHITVLCIVHWERLSVRHRRFVRRLLQRREPMFHRMVVRSSHPLCTKNRRIKGTIAMSASSQSRNKFTAGEDAPLPFHAAVACLLLISEQHAQQRHETRLAIQETAMQATFKQNIGKRGVAACG